MDCPNKTSHKCKLVHELLLFLKAANITDNFSVHCFGYCPIIFSCLFLIVCFISSTTPECCAWQDICSLCLIPCLLTKAWITSLTTSPPFLSPVLSYASQWCIPTANFLLQIFFFFFYTYSCCVSFSGQSSTHPQKIHGMISRDCLFL